MFVWRYDENEWIMHWLWMREQKTHCFRPWLSLYSWRGDRHKRPKDCGSPPSGRKEWGHTFQLEFPPPLFFFFFNALPPPYSIIFVIIRCVAKMLLFVYRWISPKEHRCGSEASGLGGQTHGRCASLLLFFNPYLQFSNAAPPPPLIILSQ